MKRAPGGVGRVVALSGGVATLVVASVVGVASYYLVSHAVKNALAPRPAGVQASAWAPFSPPGEGYVVQMPGTPKTVNLTTNGVAITGHVLVLQNSLCSFNVSYADYQAGLVTPDLLSKMAAVGRDAVVTSMKGKVIGERVCTMNGRPANEYQVQGADAVVLVQRWTVARVGKVDRVYILAAGGPNYSPDSGDAARFFDSFTVEAPPAVPPPVNPPPTPKPNGNPPVAVRPTPPPAPNPRAPATFPAPPAPNPPPPVKPGDVLTEVAQVEGFLSCAVDPERKTAFFCGPTAFLRAASYPDFKIKGTYAIDGAACRAALDANNGKLYLAVTDPKNLDPRLQGAAPWAPNLRALAVADVHVYDIRGVRDGTTEPDAKLAPALVVPLAAKIESLLLSPDGKWLYYLDVTDPAKAKAGRVATASGEKSPEIALAANTEILRLSPDGKKLYAAASVHGHQYYTKEPLEGVFQVLDAAGWKLEKTFDIDVDPCDVAPTDEGLLYVPGGSNQWTDLTVIDARTASVVARWPQFYMGLSARLSLDGKRLYLSERGTSPNQFYVVTVPEKPEDKGKALQDLRVPFIGYDFYPTPDGQYVLTSAGHVYKVIR